MSHLEWQVEEAYEQWRAQAGISPTRQQFCRVEKERGGSQISKRSFASPYEMVSSFRPPSFLTCVKYVLIA